MTLAGRLAGTLDGRPVSLEANDDGVTLSLASLSTAWSLRGMTGRVPLGAPLRLLRFLKANEIRVMVAVGSLARIEILPRPHRLARLLVPALGEL
ncbi:MAG: hypothetical protein FJ292_02735 [Planctomycetes bacterium]|nr:hypothetical protein [Planctomycetota bacterium]